MPDQYTVEQINAHLASGLKRVILFGNSGHHYRVMEARYDPTKVREPQMQVRFDFSGPDGWSDVQPGTRIDLTK